MRLREKEKAVYQRERERERERAQHFFSSGEEDEYEKLVDLRKAAPYLQASTHMTLASPCGIPTNPCEVFMTSQGIKGHAPLRG